MPREDNYYLGFDILKPCVDLLTHEAESMSVKIETQAECEAFVHTDKTRVQCILINLLQNAILVSEPNSRVVVRMEECGPNEYRFTILDEGPGLPVKIEEDLFASDQSQLNERRDSIALPAKGVGLYQSKLLA